MPVFSWPFQRPLFSALPQYDAVNHHLPPFVDGRVPPVPDVTFLLLPVSVPPVSAPPVFLLPVSVPPVFHRMVQSEYHSL